MHVETRKNFFFSFFFWKVERVGVITRLPSLISLVRLTPSRYLKSISLFSIIHTPALFIFYSRNEIDSSHHPYLPPSLSSCSPSPSPLSYDSPTPQHSYPSSALLAPPPPLTPCPPRASSYILLSSEMPRPNPPFPLAEARGMCKAERVAGGLLGGGWEGVGGGENALELQGVTVGRARGPARSNTSRCYLPSLHYPATMRPL